MFCKVRLVCVSMSAPVIFPVLGSMGPCPATKRKLSALTPWEYGPRGCGAFGVLMNSLLMLSYHQPLSASTLKIEWSSFFEGLLGNLVFPLLKKRHIFGLLSQIVREHMRNLINNGIPAIAFWASDYSGTDFIFLLEDQQF